MTGTVEKYLGTTEIARLVGVHHTTVARWINSGKMKAYSTLGGRKRVRMRDLVDIVQENNLPFPEELLPEKKTRILVVDDDESVLNILADSLRQSDAGFVVETAKDGFQAGRIMERVKLDAVVLDICLPGLRGDEICRIIKQGHPDIKVIAITGYGSEKVRQQILDAGADVYMTKPVDIDEFVEEVKKVLGHSLEAVIGQNGSME